MLFVSTSASAEAPSSSPPICFERAGEFSKLAHKVYALDRWRKPPSRHTAGVKALHQKRACAASPQVRAKMRRIQRTQKRELYRHRAYRKITPYYGGGHWWAIPFSIIACESYGGSWSASNSIGAHGAYQLLDKGEPWPVNSWRDKMTHHRIAAGLWAGGAGASHWTECL